MIYWPAKTGPGVVSAAFPCLHVIATELRARRTSRFCWRAKAPVGLPLQLHHQQISLGLIVIIRRTEGSKVFC